MESRVAGWAVPVPSFGVSLSQHTRHFHHSQFPLDSVPYSWLSQRGRPYARGRETALQWGWGPSGVRKGWGTTVPRGKTEHGPELRGGAWGRPCQGAGFLLASCVTWLLAPPWQLLGLGSPARPPARPLLCLWPSRAQGESSVVPACWRGRSSSVCSSRASRESSPDVLRVLRGRPLPL